MLFVQVGNFYPVGIFDPVLFFRNHKPTHPGAKKTGMLRGVAYAIMNILRLIVLLALLLYGATAIDRARQVIRAKHNAQKGSAPTVTGMNKKYSRYAADRAAVNPVGMLVQDSMLLGTGLDQIAGTFQKNKTEAIQDAQKQRGTLRSKDGVLYASLLAVQ